MMFHQPLLLDHIYHIISFGILQLTLMRYICNVYIIIQCIYLFMLDHDKEIIIIQQWNNAEQVELTMEFSIKTTQRVITFSSMYR